MLGNGLRLGQLQDLEATSGTSWSMKVCHWTKPYLRRRSREVAIELLQHNILHEEMLKCIRHMTCESDHPRHNESQVQSKHKGCLASQHWQVGADAGTDVADVADIADVGVVRVVQFFRHVRKPTCRFLQI